MPQDHDIDHCRETIRKWYATSRVVLFWSSQMIVDASTLLGILGAGQNPTLWNNTAFL